MTKSLKYFYLTIIYLFFYSPIFILIFFSFNQASFSTNWQGFTWQWYLQLWQDDNLLTATYHSLYLGLIASTVATALGSMAAVALYRYRFFGKNLLHGLIFSLIVLPDIVMGIALLMLFTLTTIPLGFTSLVLAHITFCIPFAVVTIYSRLKDTDKNLFDAARDLGARDSQIFTKILIPLLLPAILAAWLLNFTLSIDDVIVSFFVSGPSFQILPLYIYSLVRLGITPEINALCSVIFVFTLILVSLSQFALRQKS